MNLYCGIGVTNSASSHAVEGVSGRAQGAAMVPALGRGHGGCNHTGVTGRLAADDAADEASGIWAEGAEDAEASADAEAGAGGRAAS
eukprot:CAMPEP_0179290818 /NCGR_PEP_ID=MMETSP0797-20121207/42016_1 /TAXON_ID=47934 /ORGANISM="Dinophysis acuminata, Strain DAEP01" /LENGTH=86 /DNA_ID=CAMNT_0020999871 /DNA_START=336 /DNA_END=592 /DNA_ORIENTATION=-